MKRALIALAIIFNTQFSIFNFLHAQDEYRIEQVFPVAIRQLTVAEGWTIRLFYTPGEDSTRVTVVTPCPYYFEEGNEPTVCALDGEKLHIRDNRSMPLGTLLEVRYPEPLELLMTAGNVELDTVHMLLRSEGPRTAGVFPGNRTLKIKCLFSTGDIGVDCRHERSRVEIGTLRCRRFFVDEREQSRIKVEHMEADSLVVVPHHWWHNINWNNNILYIGGKMGVASLMSQEATPYSTSLMTSFSMFGRWLDLPFSRRWRLEAGFGGGFDFNMLAYDVLLEDDRLVFNPDYTVDHPITVIGQWYLTMPLKLQFRPVNPWARLICNHLDLTLTPMLNILGDVTGYRDGEFYSDNVNLFSRFQLRLGVSNTCLASVRDDIISGGITWEIFVDLLPTYRPSAGAKGLHQIGFVVHF